MIYKLVRVPDSRIMVSVATAVKGIEASGKYRYISSYMEPSPGLFGYVDLHIQYEEIADCAKNFKWRHPLGAFASGLKKKDEYTFRGETNIQKVILDCLKDNKVGFIIIEKSHIWFGVREWALGVLPYPFDEMSYVYKELSFYINRLPKGRTSAAVKYLKMAQKIWVELPEKLSKEIRKDNRKKDKAGIKRKTVKVKVF